MSVNQKASQTLQETQTTVLSPQQLLVVKLTELPVADLEERVKNEVIDNIALEEGKTDSNNDDNTGDTDFGDSDDAYDESGYDADSPEPVEDDMADYRPDDIPPYIEGRHEAGGCEIPIGETRSFIDELKDQISEYDITPAQYQIVDYLIGSLSSNGFLEKSIESIADELVIYHNVDTDEKQIEEALSILQRFDPPGIGARNLQECLVLQLERKLQKKTDKEELLKLAKDVVGKYFNLFIDNKYSKIMDATGMTADKLNAVVAEIKKLNPRPGMALNETSADRVNTVIPDFIIETDDEGNVFVSLNDGNVPNLHINRDYEQSVEKMQSQVKQLSKREKEAFDYSKNKLEAAKMFIDAIETRRRTLYSTMNAIVKLQKPFFLSQDDDDLKPMILKDVAELTNLDISTISRVRNSKYAMVDGNVFALSHFFDRTRVTAGGQELNARQLKQRIKDIIDAEDKHSPFSDEDITKLLNKEGMNVKRRTVAKYRDQLAIPMARQRKEI